MTPRERWLAVLRRERPDRVPMDYWATGEANQKLMRHLGCATMQAVLRGEVPDKIPFTIYESKLPQCAVKRQLRNEGLCIVNRRFSVFRTHSPNVRMETVSYTENGVDYVRRTYHTPVGDLFTIDRPAGFTSWHVCKLFKQVEDYKPLFFRYARRPLAGQSAGDIAGHQLRFCQRIANE
jgi:hypothetical protein